MEKQEKALYYQYVLHRLLAWSVLMGNSENTNNISVLKSLKLLFFVSAAKASPEDQNTLLDLVFTKYLAMPYGHVEGDVYDVIKTEGGTFEYFSINNKSVSRNKEIGELINELNEAYKVKIDASVDYLIMNHPKLISMSAFDLVELSHLWYSWRKNYSLAEAQGVRSLEIPIEDIKLENKIYSLQTIV